MSASLRRSPESRSGWCWEACLRTLDVPAPAGWNGRKHPSLHALREHLNPWFDLEYIPFTADWSKPANPPTLARFIAEHPTGTYLITTSEHVMVLRDGILTDTDQATGRRRLISAYRLVIR